MQEEQAMNKVNRARSDINLDIGTISNYEQDKDDDDQKSSITVPIKLKLTPSADVRTP